MNSDKQFSPACERNREPILAILREIFATRSHVLEIGSGSGQHAVHFAPALPHLRWQSSDLATNHASILAWQAEFPSANLAAPLLLDMQETNWPNALANAGIDAIFSANTCHIMPWHCVQHFLRGAAQLLPSGGLLAIYGPFNEHGAFTSESNAQFDASLRERNPQMGIRDKVDLQHIASAHHLHFVQDFAMPANNQLLLWQKN